MRGLALARAFTGIAITGAAACGGSSLQPPGQDAGGAEHDAASVFVEAPHSPLPELVYQGGPLLLAPKIVTVTFAGDPNASALEAFDDAIVASTWWSQVTAGFCNGAGACVGSGSSGGHVSLTTPPAASYTDATSGGISSLQQFLDDQISGGLFPAPDANTLYVIYFPPSTTIDLSEADGDERGTSCQQFGGYHNSTVSNQGAAAVPYAVIPECPPAAGSSLSQLESLTFAASHEIVEAVTDPVETATSLGYYLNLSDSSVLGWNLLSGGEAADLCVDLMGPQDDMATADGYTVQRIWSNASAASGGNPCIPALTKDVYFNVAPAGTNAYLVLDVGQSATFEADAFSSEARSPWTLGGVDWATAQKELNAPLLSFTFNGQPSLTVNNGDKVQVTVTLDADPAQLGSAGGLLLSTDGPTAAHSWPILVLTPDEATGHGS